MNHTTEERRSSDKKQARNKSILKNGNNGGSGNKSSRSSTTSSSQRHHRQHSGSGGGGGGDKEESPRKKSSKSRSTSDIYDTPRVSSSVKWREDLTAAYEMTMAGRYNRRGSSVEHDDESESGAVYENLRIGSGGGGGGGGGQADGNSLYDVPRPIPKKIDMLYINKSFEDGVYDEPRRQPAKTTSHDNIMNSDEDLIEWDYDLPKGAIPEEDQYDTPRRNSSVENLDDNVYENEDYTAGKSEPIYMNEMNSDHSSGYRSSPSVHSEENIGWSPPSPASSVKTSSSPGSRSSPADNSRGTSTSPPAGNMPRRVESPASRQSNRGSSHRLIEDAKNGRNSSDREDSVDRIINNKNSHSHKKGRAPTSPDVFNNNKSIHEDNESPERVDRDDNIDKLNEENIHFDSSSDYFSGQSNGVGLQDVSVGTTDTLQRLSDQQNQTKNSSAYKESSKREDNIEQTIAQEPTYTKVNKEAKKERKNQNKKNEDELKVKEDSDFQMLSNFEWSKDEAAKSSPPPFEKSPGDTWTRTEAKNNKLVTSFQEHKANNKPGSGGGAKGGGGGYDDFEPVEFEEFNPEEVALPIIEKKEKVLNDKTALKPAAKVVAVKTAVKAAVPVKPTPPKEKESPIVRSETINKRNSMENVIALRQKFETIENTNESTTITNGIASFKSALHRSNNESREDSANELTLNITKSVAKAKESIWENIDFKAYNGRENVKIFAPNSTAHTPTTPHSVRSPISPAKQLPFLSPSSVASKGFSSPTPFLAHSAPKPFQHRSPSQSPSPPSPKSPVQFSSSPPTHVRANFGETVKEKKLKNLKDRDRYIEVYHETIRQRTVRDTRNLTPDVFKSKFSPISGGATKSPGVSVVSSASKTQYFETLTINNNHIYSNEVVEDSEPEPEEESRPMLPSVKQLLSKFESCKSPESKILLPLPAAPIALGKSFNMKRGMSSESIFYANDRKSQSLVKSKPLESPPLVSNMLLNKSEPHLLEADTRHGAWDPHRFVKGLYNLPVIEEDNTYANLEDVDRGEIEGHVEKLPTGRRRPTLWNAWRKAYVVAKKGYLYVYPNEHKQTYQEKFELFGGQIDFLDNCMVGLEDRTGKYLVLRTATQGKAQVWEKALSVQTQESFSKTFLTPQPIPRDIRMLTNLIVVDLGGSSVRAGFCADSPCLPMLFFPSLMAVNPDNTQEKYFGFDALKEEVRKSCNIYNPLLVSHSIDKYSIDLVALCGLLLKVFQELRVDPRTCELQLSVPRTFNEKTKLAIASLLFEEFEVEALNVGHQSTFSLLSYSTNTGVIVDIGNRIDIVPIVQGYKVASGVSKVSTGGVQLHDQMRQSLAGRNYALNSPLDTFIIGNTIERLCFISRNYSDEIDDVKSAERSVYMNEGCKFQSITLGTERFHVPEGIFKPELWGLDHPGLHVLVRKAIMECSVDVRKEVSQSIFLSGGLTLLPGFKQRLQQELNKILPIPPQVHASSYRYHAAFLGACAHALSPEFQQQKVTKTDWNSERIMLSKYWVM